MKVLHVCFGFPPDPPGGTEVYVESLCRELMKMDVVAVVAAPAPRVSSYVHAGLQVRRFAVSSQSLDLQALHATGDPESAMSFARLLDAERPDVMHQHALTPACSVRLTEAARERGVPVVFTYHTPATSCARGTLVERGRRPCDGRLDVTRCTACVLDGYGVPAAAARLLAHVPGPAGTMLARASGQGRPATALRMRGLMDARQHAFHRLVGLVDRFVALGPWVEDLLRLNGVTPEHIVTCPHGVPWRPATQPLIRDDHARVRLAHFARLDPAKGTALLVRALRSASGAAVDLDVFGIVQSEGDRAREEALRRLAAGDGRIRFLPAIDPAEVVGTLAHYDAVAVPSQGFETGPLVVLEAQAAGVPVVGSAIGGIADKVRDEVDGLLVSPFSSIPAWATTLRRCATETGLIARLRAGIRPPRTMATVASEMASLYHSVVQRPAVAVAAGA